MRKITLCADDYGLSSAVSAAIRELLCAGRLNATSVMMGGEVEAKALLALPHTFQIGLHLTLTKCFKPLPSISYLMLKSFLRLNNTIALRSEINGQIDGFITAFGRMPDYIDGHQHCHLLPQISDILLEILRERGFKGWLRQTGGAGVGMKAKIISFLSHRFITLAEGFILNKSFSGSYHFNGQGNYRALFKQFLQADLIMCHPGRVDETLKQRDTMLGEREHELAYFLSDEFLQDLKEAHVIL